MALTSPREVNSGFFRVHLWVLLGLATFGSLVAYSQQDLFSHPTVVTGLAISIAVMCYVGSVIWFYEQSRAGIATLVIITVLSTILLLFAHPSKQVGTAVQTGWLLVDILSGSHAAWIDVRRDAAGTLVSEFAVDETRAAKMALDRTHCVVSRPSDPQWNGSEYSLV